MREELKMEFGIVTSIFLAFLSSSLGRKVVRCSSLEIVSVPRLERKKEGEIASCE